MKYIKFHKRDARVNNLSALVNNLRTRVNNLSRLFWGNFVKQTVIYPIS